MDLPSLTRRWELLEEALQLESFEQHAGKGGPEAAGEAGRARGRGGDPARMEALAAEIEALAREALDAFGRRDLPPLLWQGLVAGRAARELTRHQNETYRLRNEAVRVEVRGETVDLNGVRLFNHRHARDAARRKEAFDGLMAKAPLLTPTLEARFRASAAAWAPFGMTPLDAYLVEERVSREDLIRTVDRAARAAKPAFVEAADAFSREVLGKPFECYDDMYVFRHAIFQPVDAAFAHVDFREAFLRTARGLGLAAEGVWIDGEPREGKYSSPVCFGVRVPGDVRVLYQRTSPVGDYESFYHEMGHAVHFAHVDPSRAFDERRLVPAGVMEIFSTLFEALGMDPLYLEEDLGIAREAVQETLRRRRFMELYFLAFYGANSMHKIRFWDEGLHEDFARADEAYADLTERYMGVRLPGVYWQTHHVLSMSDVYAPSYLLANVRKSEMLRLLQERFGRRWWRDPEAGAWLRDRAMAPGAAIDLDAFSRLDADAYVRPIVEGWA